MAHYCQQSRHRVHTRRVPREGCAAERRAAAAGLIAINVSAAGSSRWWGHRRRRRGWGRRRRDRVSGAVAPVEARRHYESTSTYNTRSPPTNVPQDKTDPSPSPANFNSGQQLDASSPTLTDPPLLFFPPLCTQQQHSAELFSISLSLSLSRYPIFTYPPRKQQQQHQQQGYYTYTYLLLFCRGWVG